jgi:hypothetical protein
MANRRQHPDGSFVCRWRPGGESFIRSAPAAPGCRGAAHLSANLTGSAPHPDRALLRLSPRKRIVILMVDGEGLTGEEVARALDIPLGTVWTRLHYGRAELRAALDQAK